MFVSSAFFRMPGKVRVSLKRTVPSYGRAGRFVGAQSQRASKMASARGSAAPYRAYGYGETKYFDTGIKAVMTSGSTDWTGSEVPCDNYVNSSGTKAAYTDSALIPSAPGVSYGQVSGNRYHLKKLRVRGIIQRQVAPNAADVTQGFRYRLMLVHDSGPNGAQAQGEDVMQDVGEDETIFSFKRMAAQGSRFRILKDQTGILENIISGSDHATLPSTLSLGYQTIPFSFQYVPTTPINISVRSAAAASAPSIGNLVDGNIFLLLQTNGQQLTLTGASRCYYTDK